MSKPSGWRELDARAHDSMVRFHNRTGWEPTSNDMPFARSLDQVFTESLHDFIAAAGEVESTGEEQFVAWSNLQARASELTQAGASEAAEAQRAADEFYEQNENRITAYRERVEAGEHGAAKLGEHDMKQRLIGAVALFDFLQKRGHTPMDFFRQFTAVGRALYREPWSLMTMHEVAMMEGQSAAAHSWRCQLMNGERGLKGMQNVKLPGQKSAAARESYKRCRKGNQNRKGGKKKRKPRQGSFLAKLKTAPKSTQQSFLQKLKTKNQ